MKNAKPANFSTLLDDIGEACVTVMRSCGRAARGIADLPWPALLVAALVLAFALTIVPVALFLFVVFMVIKFAVAAIVIGKQRQRGE